MNVFSQIFTIQNSPKFCLKSFYKKCERIYVKLLSSVLKTGSFYGAFAHVQIHTIIWGSRLVEKKNLRVVVNFKDGSFLVLKSAHSASCSYHFHGHSHADEWLLGPFCWSVALLWTSEFSLIEVTIFNKRMPHKTFVTVVCR